MDVKANGPLTARDDVETTIHSEGFEALQAQIQRLNEFDPDTAHSIGKRMGIELNSGDLIQGLLGFVTEWTQDSPQMRELFGGFLDALIIVEAETRDNLVKMLTGEGFQLDSYSDEGLPLFLLDGHRISARDALKAYFLRLMMQDKVPAAERKVMH